MSFLKNYTESSFFGLLKTEYPELLQPVTMHPDVKKGMVSSTTIAALRVQDGVIIGGDERICNKSIQDR